MKINVDILSAKSIDEARRQIDALIEKLHKLEKELPRRLAEYGAADAQVRFDNAAYDILVYGGGSHPAISVTAQQTDNGYAVVANGKEVCFVEFGAGVYYNGDGGSYLGTRPVDIAGIGEYGDGKGQNPSWYFKDEATGEVRRTHGTPASNALYFTARDMEEKVAEIAKEILTNDRH